MAYFAAIPTGETCPNSIILCSPLGVDSNVSFVTLNVCNLVKEPCVAIWNKYTNVYPRFTAGEFKTDYQCLEKSKLLNYKIVFLRYIYANIY
jgi:hypothetical protein